MAEAEAALQIPLREAQQARQVAEARLDEAQQRLAQQAAQLLDLGQQRDSLAEHATPARKPVARAAKARRKTS